MRSLTRIALAFYSMLYAEAAMAEDYRYECTYYQNTVECRFVDEEAERKASIALYNALRKNPDLLKGRFDTWYKPFDPKFKMAELFEGYVYKLDYESGSSTKQISSEEEWALAAAGIKSGAIDPRSCFYIGIKGKPDFTGRWCPTKK